MPEITEAQRKTLKELRDFIASRKYPPTMSELGERLGVAAASAHQLVKQLELSICENNARTRCSESFSQGATDSGDRVSAYDVRREVRGTHEVEPP